MYYFPALLVTLGFCGLRDYGTGEWSGGDADCDHAPPPRQPRADRPDPHGFGTRSVLAAQDQGSTAYRDVCGRCGARRVDSQIGLEATPSEYVERMVAVFREVWRVLRDDGTVWLNLGSSFVSDTIESNEYRLRSDLTPEDVAYVYAELARAKAEAVSELRTTDGQAKQ